MRSRKLQRQFLKTLETENAEGQFLQLANKLRTRDAVFFEADIALIARLPELFSSIDRAYQDHAEQSRIDFHNLELSSAELNEANAKLENLNISITAMLNTLGQGLFAFTADGLCTDTYSKACLTLIEKNPAGKPIADVLQLNADARETITPLLQLIFSSHSTEFHEDFLALLPDTYPHSQGLSISLEYRPILDAQGTVRAILAIATDHTNELAAKKIIAQRELSAQMVLRISGNRNLFTRFFQSAVMYFSVTTETLSDDMPIDILRRDIHTIKGNASIFYLQDFVDFLHTLESSLDLTQSPHEIRNKIRNSSVEALKLLSEVRAQAARLFGDDFDRQGSTRTVPLDLLRSFAVELRHGQDKALADRFVSLLMGEPIRKQLVAFDIGLQELADRYGRKVAPCLYSGDNFSVLSENYEGLFSSLTHIARNIIAHAADAPDLRAKWHKPEYLTVTLHTECFSSEGMPWMRLAITDDGHGINTERLRALLEKEKGPAAVALLSDQEIMQSIFDDKLTTRIKIDELSGRGLGMSAVKAEVEKLGGNITVESEMNRFTRITIEAPIFWD